MSKPHTPIFARSDHAMPHGDVGYGNVSPAQRDAAVRDSEERFGSSFEHAPVGMAITGPNGQLWRVNPRFCDMLGYAPEILVGMTFPEITHPDDGPTYLKMIERLLRRELDGVSTEKRYIHRDGHAVYGVSSVSLLWSPDGTPLYFVTQVYDATAAILTQRMLSRYRLLAENTNDIILFIVGDGHVMDVNEAAVRAYGYTRAELLGMHASNLRSAAAGVDFDTQFGRALEGSVLFETEHRRKDGTCFPVEVRSQTIEMDGVPTLVSRITDITERKRAEEAVRASEARLRAVHENAGIGISQASMEGILITCNPALLHMLGYTKEELQGANLQRFTHPDDAPLELDLLAELLAGRRDQYEVHKRILRKDGSYHWFHTVRSLVRDRNGRPDFVIGLLVAINEQKRIEQELRESRRALNTVLSNLPGAVYRAGEDFGVEFVSEGCRRLFGYEPEVLTHNPRFMYDVVTHPEDRAAVLATVRAAIAAGQPFQLSYRIVTASGEVRWVWEQGRAISGAEGDPVYLEGFVTDHTDLKHAEISLQQSEERFRFLLEQGSEGISVLNEQGVVLYSAPTVKRVTGLEPHEMVGRNAFAMIHPDDLDTVKRAFRICLRKPEEVIRAETRLRQKDGSWLYVELSGKNLLHRPEVNGIVINARDITERKAGERALQDSESRFRTMFETAGVGILMADSQHRALESNRAMQDMLGYSGAEFARLTYEDVTHPDDVPREDPLIADLYSGRIASYALEKRYRHKDGHWIWAEATVTLLPDLEGQRRYALAMVKDLTSNRAAEERFRNLNQAIPQLVWTTRPDGYHDYFNERWYEYTGLPPGASDGTEWSTVLHPDDLERTMARWRHSIQTGEPYEIEYRFRRASDGTYRWFLGRALAVRDDEGRIVGWFGTCTDIDDQKRAKEAVQQLAAIVESSGDAIYGFSLTGDIVSWNAGAEALYGYTAEEMVGQSFNIIVPDDAREEALLMLRHLANTGEIRHYEAKRRRRDGREIPVSIAISPLYDEQGRVVGASAIARDISERTRLEERLAHQAFHDALTDLPNRALFMDRLSHALLRGRGDHNRLAVLFLDLDRFKVVNDSLGHAVGDELLAVVASRLRGCVRAGDTVARLGGDEFTILLDSVEHDGEGIRLAERILRRLNEPFNVHGHELFVSASIGVVMRGAERGNAEGVLRDADVAMYQAKAAGRGRYAVFQPKMTMEAQEQLRLETELRRAIERNEFRVYYQPIVLMETGRVIGAEALVRWKHPRFGLMPPDQFIPLQEQIGLIEPFTMWVLREAQMQCLAWHNSGHKIAVSVNLSPRNLHSPGFAERVLALLAETGLPPHALKLEVTESAVVMDPHAAVEVLSQLSNIGVRLSMDDFGTGYSSLSYLKQLPVHEVKIDKSFVMGMDERDEDDAAIVRAIVDLGHNLRKKVVAEGVETSDVWDMLKVLGCDAAQGYLMGRPMPAEATQEWLNDSPWGTCPTSASLLR